MSTDHLFASSFAIAGLNLPNRIVLPPLVIWKAGQSGEVTDDHVNHYAESVGPGLMIVEATTISPEGRLAATQLGIWSDSQVPGLAKLARLIRASGAMAGIQIHHAGGKTKLEHTYGEAPLVPSLTERSPEGAREMTESDIERLIAAFADATRRAVKAGFDYIELHGAHGYLISQFLSLRDNKRTDRWGGSLQNRMRFGLEAYRSARAAAGADAVVSMRLGISDGRSDGVVPEDGLALARELAGLGCPLLHISHAGGQPQSVVPAGSPFSATMHLAGMVKADIPVAVIGVGDVFTPEQADRVIDAGLADLVAVGRAMLADPGWTEKALEGRENDIELCVDCRPRCFHFHEAERCPARKRLAAR